MTDDEIKKLAENLIKSGLASSEYEAIEKAKSIINVSSQKIETKDQEVKQENKPIIPNLGVELKNETGTLNELMKEVGVTPEQVKTVEKEKLDRVHEKIQDIKENIKDAQQNPEKVEQVKQDIQKVKQEVDKVEETKEDMFEQEKKIDLSKLFSYKK